MYNRKYSVSKKRIDMLTDIELAHNILQKQIDILYRVSSVLKLVIDRLSTTGSVLNPILNKNAP
jgi:hypothetical protein